MESRKSEAAKDRWSGLSATERKKRTSAGNRTYRVNAAKRRIEKALTQIEKDRALIEELTSST